MNKTSILLMTILPLMGYTQNALFIPDTLTGPAIDLNLQYGEVEFYAGFNTNTIGYDQDILGQTLILEKGRDVTINVINNLEEATTVHWHGLHVSAKNDGGPHTVIEAGEIWSPTFTVLDNAATYWYHPHLHEHTEEQVTKGAAGFIIVRDKEEAALQLPRSYGVDDFPIVLQSRAFDADKQFLVNTAADDVMLVNGTFNAYLDLPAQIIRLRMINGSTERVYRLGLEGNLPFYQIASDGGLLDAPVPLTRLALAPGERAEILVDLSTHQGQSFSLMSFASEIPVGVYGASRPSFMPFISIDGYEANPLNGQDFEVLEIKVVAATGDPITSVPSALVINHPYPEETANATRTFTFRPAQMGPNGMVNGPFLINERSFDLDFINFVVPLGNTEIWEVRNMTAIAHPFHIHGVQFNILSIDGETPPLELQGRKDVVLISPMNGSVRLITQFEDFTDKVVPYMYHCHMLSHEDDGMMGQFIVEGSTTATTDNKRAAISIYPNPSTHSISISGSNMSSIELYNTEGQVLVQMKSSNREEQVDLSDFPSSIYFLRVITTKGSQIEKIIKN